MKGQAKVSGQDEYLNDTPSPITSSSSNLGSHYLKYYEDHHPPTSHPISTSQELVGKNDGTYRLFVVPLS
jgi:hypothetical protein